MKKIIILSFFSSILLANELDILQADKKELRKMEKKIIQENNLSNKNDWIGTINITSNINKNYDFKTSESSNTSSSVTLGYSQSIYEFGGIEYSIEHAKKQLKTDLILWENENINLLENIYETLLNIKKIKLQVEQIEYDLDNKQIELELKKIQYKAGKADIIDLNNALMARNNQLKEKVSLINSLKHTEFELSKYTTLKFEEIDLIDFKVVKKEQFLKDNINIKYEKSKIDLLEVSHKQLKSSYLPKISLSSSATYQDNENYKTTGSVGLNLSMPIFDITKKSKLESSKLEVLKQAVNISDLKNELEYEYEQILTTLDTYENHEKTIKENLKLYEDLIEANTISNRSGMTATYDLDILKNTKTINEYDLKINEINKKLQYSKLYFKTKVNL